MVGSERTAPRGRRRGLRLGLLWMLRLLLIAFGPTLLAVLVAYGVKVGLLVVAGVAAVFVFGSVLAAWLEGYFDYIDNWPADSHGS